MENYKGSFSDILINFRNKIRELNGRFTKLNFDMSDYQMAQGLLSNIEVPLDFLQNKMPTYIVPETKHMEIQSFSIQDGEFPRFSFSVIVYLNQGKINNSVTKIDNLSPLELAGIIKSELLDIALGLIIDAFAEKHIKQTQELYDAGFGSF